MQKLFPQLLFVKETVSPVNGSTSVVMVLLIPNKDAQLTTNKARIRSRFFHELTLPLMKKERTIKTTAKIK